VPPPFAVGSLEGTEHATPYSYDTQVPLAFYGLAFQPGTYRTRVEPVDLAPTLASLLGIIAPSHSIGRVLTEALAPARREPAPVEKSRPGSKPSELRPAVLRVAPRQEASLP